MRYIAFGWMIAILLLLLGGGILLFYEGCPLLASICIALFITGIFSFIEFGKDE